MIARATLMRVVAAAAVFGVAGGAMFAQPAPPPAPQAVAAEEPRQTFTQQELDQMLAPVALYPDDLLNQVLMASTYPLEVVEADRWAKANAALQGDPLADALEQQPWDPSVKSLVNSPTVLAMMSEKLDWTSRLGDAFIGQQDAVMDTVQKLRAKADAQGTLKTTPQQRVVVQNDVVPAATKVIVIEPVNPEVIYVPVYDPTVVYGPWWWPAYPPVYYYPPVYPHSFVGIWFGVSFHCGPPWGYAWGHSDWDHHRLVIDVNRHIELNRHIDRTVYRERIERRDDRFHADRDVWVHDPAHRRGVVYRDAGVAQRFGAVSDERARQQREAFRGRVERRPDGSVRSEAPSHVERPQEAARPAVPAREPPRGVEGAARPEERHVAPAEPPPHQVVPERGAALGGVERDAASVRHDSERGAASRTPSPVRAEPSPSRSGGGERETGGDAHGGGGPHGR